MKAAKHITRLSGYHHCLSSISFRQPAVKVHDNLVELIRSDGVWNSEPIRNLCNWPSRCDELLNFLFGEIACSCSTLHW